MHEDMIEKFFYGKLTPIRSFVYFTEEYHEASKNSGELRKQLESSLNDKQIKLLEELIGTNAVMSDEMVLGAFKDGFKIGMGLAVDGLKYDDDIEEK